MDSRTQLSLDKVNEIVDLIACATDEARASAVFKRWLEVQAKFWNYSYYNSILIAAQAKSLGFTAQKVAGAVKWKEMNRKVKSDQWKNRLWILAPVFKKYRDAETGEFRQVLTGFRSVYVFDVSQTEGEELPSLEYRISDDDHGLSECLEKEYARRNVCLEFVEEILGNPEIKGASYGGRVQIKNSLKASEKAATMAHELAHEILHWAGNKFLETEHSRSEQEIEAEGTAAVILAAWGLDYKASGFYLAAWNGDSKKIKSSMSRIGRTAKDVLVNLVPF